MKNSKIGFISLASSLIGLIASFIYWIIFLSIGIAFDGLIQAILQIAPLLNMMSFLIALTGAIICFFKARVGGIFLIIASAISLICYATICIATKSFEAVIILMIIPTLVNLFSGIKASKQRKKP